MRRRKRQLLPLLVAVALSAAAAAAAQAAPAPAPTYTGTDPNDVAALLALRSSLSNTPPNWAASDDPCGGQPNCEGMPLALNQCAWRGITCTNGRVTQIEVPCLRTMCYNLRGSLPASLANASALQLIDLRGNSIDGGLPPEWGTLSSMMQLLLDWNYLKGTLPSEYGNLTAVTYIGLQGNGLGGKLPPSWGNLTALQLLDLGRNRLGGGFPPEWSGMRSLQALNLESNDFEGPLPSEWGIGMVSLVRLSVRMMCAVCGRVPFVRPVDIWMQGSSLTQACSKSNCYKMPLGFVGQAVIIAAIILVLASLCLVRRCYVTRRTRRQDSASRRARAANGMGPDDLSAEDDAEPPRPPVLVVMPDGQSLCTAREDADWKAALAAAEGGDNAVKESGQAAAAPGAPGADTSPSRLRWWERLPAGIGSPARRQQQQQETQQQSGLAAVPLAGAVGIELAGAASEPAPPARPSSRSGSRSRVSRGSAGAAGDQGSSRPGSALSASSSRSDSSLAQQQQQQQQDIVPPHRLRPSSWRGGEAGDAAAARRMTRASTGQQLALQQAGLVPPAPRASANRRPRRPVPIFDIEVPWGASGAGATDGDGGSGSGGSVAEGSSGHRPGSAASGSSGPGAADGMRDSHAMPAQHPFSLV